MQSSLYSRRVVTNRRVMAEWVRLHPPPRLAQPASIHTMTSLPPTDASSVLILPLHSLSAIRDPSIFIPLLRRITRRTTDRLLVLCHGSALHPRGPSDQAGWSDVQRFLGIIYSAVAQEAARHDRVLFEVDVLIEGFAGDERAGGRAGGVATFGRVGGKWDRVWVSDRETDGGVSTGCTARLAALTRQFAAQRRTRRCSLHACSICQTSLRSRPFRTASFLLPLGDQAWTTRDHKQRKPKRPPLLPRPIRSSPWAGHSITFTPGTRSSCPCVYGSRLARLSWAYQVGHVCPCANQY